VAKDIFKDASLLDKNKLRQERKAVLAFVIWFALLSGSALSIMKAMYQYSGFTIGKLIGVILILLSLICGIVGLIALKRLTNIVYRKANRYFISYAILIILGSFFMGLFTIIVLLKIWFDAKKLLINKQSK
jgi:Ca2+/Na+ antiporter